jgi:hypothetical protein
MSAGSALRVFTMGEDVDLAMAAAGRASARKRWGVPRTARMSDLDAAQRDLVHALIESLRARNEGRDPAPLDGSKS